MRLTQSKINIHPPIKGTPAEGLLSRSKLLAEFPVTLSSMSSKFIDGALLLEAEGLLLFKLSKSTSGRGEGFLSMVLGVGVGLADRSLSDSSGAN